MFRINVIALGKNKGKWVDEAVAHYLKFLKKYAAVDIIYLPDVRKSRKLSDSELLRREAKLIENSLKSNHLVAPSDGGHRFDTMEFAGYLSRLMTASHSSIDFVIGGVCGIDQTILDRCDEIISLSPL